MTEYFGKDSAREDYISKTDLLTKTKIPCFPKSFFNVTRIYVELIKDLSERDKVGGYNIKCWT